MKTNRKLGFTLAEVLVVITIIGIIAMETIPTLVRNIKNDAIIAGMKKSHSMLGGVVSSFKADGIEMATIFKTGSTDEAGIDAFCTKLNCIKKGAGSFPDVDYKTLYGDPWDNFSVYTDSALLSDGSIINILNFKQDCNHSIGTGFADACAEIMIDSNGAKGPNQFGKDTFFFSLTKRGIYPWGVHISNQIKTHSFGCWEWGVGTACSYRIMTEGAINY